MHRHLISVEVGIESGTDERVDMDSLTLDENRLKGLDTETMQCRSTIEEDVVILGNALENVPDFFSTRSDHPLGILHVVSHALIDEIPYHEGLE